MKRSFWLMALGLLLNGTFGYSVENSSSSLIEKIPSVAQTLPTRLPPMLSFDPATDKAESRFSNTIEALPVKHGRIAKVPNKKKKVSKDIVVVQDIRLGAESQRSLQAALKALISDKKTDLKSIGSIKSTPFMRTAGKSGDPRKNLASINTQISDLKNRFFNKKLQAFDLKVQMFNRGHMSMSSYIEMLTQMKDKSLGPKTINPQIDFYKKVQSLESQIDFLAVERERAQVVRRLVYRLEARQQQELRKMILSYRLGDVSHKEFYTYLQSACLKTGIKFNSYSSLSAYVRYVFLSDHLEPNKFFTEVKELEERRYSDLIIKPTERVLVKQTLTMNAVAKIMEMSTTSEEWAWSKNTQQ